MNEVTFNILGRRQVVNDLPFLFYDISLIIFRTDFFERDS